MVEQETQWRIDGKVASHKGNKEEVVTANGARITNRQTYTVNYEIKEIGKDGFVKLLLGDSEGVQRTKPGQYIERITASGSEPKVQFRCNTDCEIVAYKIVNNHTLVEPQRIVRSGNNNHLVSFENAQLTFAKSMYE